MAGRRHGDGSVRLRKDGRWEGRYVIGRDEKGLPKTKNVLARTKAECEAKLKALRRSLTPADPAKVEMTFGAWMDHWYQTCCRPRIRPKTQEDYENRIYQHIIPQLGHIPLAKLGPNDLQQFYARMKQGGRLLRVEEYGAGLSARMVRACHVTCRKALDEAIRQRRIPRNPAALCKAPPAKPMEMHILKPEELQRLLVQAKEDGFYEMFLLELCTGLRRGELLALQWDDLNFRTGGLRVERQVQRVRGQLAVSPPKTKASVRTVILPTPLLAVLKELKAGTNSRWIFPSPVKEDSPRDPTAVRKRLSQILAKAECSKVRFHDLRHTFATNALESGVDVKTLSTIIGHVSSATTLNVYAHVTGAMQRKAAASIDRGIVGTEVLPAGAPEGHQRLPPATFRAVKGKYRKPGTGCVRQLGDHLWEGRYSPKVNGKRRARNVYAHSEEECERLLAEMIKEMKREIQAEEAQQALPPAGR